jgi:hypothetical protein
VKAVACEPTENGLTILGGKNGQGKTSVLDALAWGLAGDRYKPDNPRREGGGKPHIKITLSNGFIVERKGDSPLTVTDPTGRKKGVTLLREFISEIAVDLPKFLEANDKGKTEYLLKVIGVGDQLAQIDGQIKTGMDSRRTQGQIAEREKASYEKMPYYPDMEGKEQADVAVLMAKQKAINEGNLKKQKKKGEIAVLRGKAEAAKAYAGSLRTQLEAAEAAANEAEEALKSLEAEAGDLTEESTAEIEGLLMTAEGWNAKIRQNAEKLAARQSAEAEAEKYKKWTAWIDAKRQERLDLLNGAKLPLAGLSVDEDMRLTYKGQTWDGMSGSEQLRVAAAIARAMNPNCGFVLMDKLEQMDKETLKEFGEWCEAEGIQVIATRVTSDEDDCTIIIEDGMGGNVPMDDTPAVQMPPGVEKVSLAGTVSVPDAETGTHENPFA